MRVVILKDFVKKNFPATPVMDYAIEVEKITTSKVLQSWKQDTMHTMWYIKHDMGCLFRKIQN